MKTTKTLFLMLLVAMFFISVGNLQAQRNYIQLTNGMNCGGSSIITSSSVTVEFWVYLDATGNAGTLFSNVAENTGFFSNIEGSNWGQFKLGNSGVWFNANPFLSSWTHFACVANGANIIVYANGVEIAKQANTTGYVTNTFNLLLATDTWGGHSSRKFADFRVWNVARSASEIAANMNSTMATSTPNLLINYTFSEQTGASTDNKMSAAVVNDGVVIGTATWGTYTVTGISEKTVNSIVVSNIENGWLLSGVSKNSKINLIGINGSLIKQLKVSENTVAIPTTNLSKGIYILQVVNNGVNQQIRVIK